MMTLALTRRQALAISSLAVAGIATGTALKSAAAGEITMSASSEMSRKNAINVAVMLGQHNTLIDVAGPWEVLSSSAYAGGAFNVYSVAATRSPVICDDSRGVVDSHMPGMRQLLLSGLTVVPDFTFETAPQPRIMIIGGQTSDEEQEREALQWIRQAANKAELSASVCTGAYLLAKSGLLDGKTATTNRNAYDDFEKKFPRIKLVRGVRFVEAGSVASAAGLTAGIDLALHIVERFFGRKTAQEVADYEEWPSKAWVTS
jgi:transcriptional regulator GlxA family with amidase domain